LTAETDRLQNGGEGIVIGIADSARHAPDSASVKTTEGADYYPTVRTTDPVGHGTDVFEILAYALPEATFQFYRVIGGRARDKRNFSDLLTAMSAARARGVDLLNISAGVPDAPTDPDSVARTEIGNIVKRGFAVVASCGNYLSETVTEMTLPAAAPEVIGISGYEPLCRCDPAALETPEDGRYTFGVSNIETTSMDVYCGYETEVDDKCTFSEECSLEEALWSGNVDPLPDAGKPDVYAPVRYPAGDGKRPRMKVGTSYGAPIVTAALGRVLAAVADTRDPGGTTLRTAVRETSRDLIGTTGNTLDASALLAELEPNSVQSRLPIE
jgi:hypothetical protein